MTTPDEGASEGDRRRRRHWSEEDKARIDALFEIERDINGLAAAERLAVRQERSAPLLADPEAWLREQRIELSRSSAVIQPIYYPARPGSWKNGMAVRRLRPWRRACRCHDHAHDDG